MLLKSINYPHEVESEILLRETHISWVYLTGKYVYKVKKPIKFGDILDFSTLEKRKEFCEKEIVLNSRLSPDIYLGVVSINSDGKITPTQHPVEYAVKMKQLPEEFLMDRLLSKGQVTEEMIEGLARLIANFHLKAKKVPERGKIEYIWEKWDENFRTTETFRPINEKFKRIIFGYMKDKKGLFEQRIKDNRIGDNHGDLTSKNIFLLPDKGPRIFDCIEFNPLLRYGDILEDVSFLTMELDFYGEKKLSEVFIQVYQDQSKDESLRGLLNFYKSYRAYVRGKVYGFQAINESNNEKREKLKELSEKYYQLAYNYSEEF